MMDLDSVLAHISLEDIELPIDFDFISQFLAPYFPDLPEEDLKARIAEVVAAERARQAAR